MKFVDANHQGVDIQALMTALPVSGLEPQLLAYITGFIKQPPGAESLESIDLLEPPAGQRVPYVDPRDALEKVLRHQGVSNELAKFQAGETLKRMKTDIAQEQWVSFFKFSLPNLPEHIPLPEFVNWLRSNGIRAIQPSVHYPQFEETGVLPHVLDFFEKVSEVAMTTLFRGPDNWNDKAWTLNDLPEVPTPKCMIEYVPGPPFFEYQDEWEPTEEKFLQWREVMRPIALGLERALGQSVYYFKEWEDELDDDDVHRFLVLHWCCTSKPDSAYVHFLVRTTGAKDVEELKAALVNPASYSHPFEMTDSLIRLEADSHRIDYLPTDTKKTVGIVFMTERAREVAESILARHIGAHAVIIAPPDLATELWLKFATRYNKGWTARYILDGELNGVLETLTLVDELWTIANEPVTDLTLDLGLNESVEDLMCLAIQVGLQTQHCLIDYTAFRSPMMTLEKRGVPQRLAAKYAQQIDFTKQLDELRLDDEYGSSGLWDKEGRNLNYDRLALPFPLIKRIAQWQRDYDNTLDPLHVVTEAWWERHDADQIDIAREIKKWLGGTTPVKIYLGSWLDVDELS